MEKKILIIEDSLQDQKLLVKLLQREGYENIYTAETGRDGIALAEQKHPDLALIDTKLPGMDGFETCRRIKEIEGLDIKVVIMTGLIETVDATKAREAGSDNYCAKTRDCKHLLEAVKKLL
ncbi:MAG: response regulator [Candidatus Omnitrophica bacterium]|nr:response regulator [Candidatus Omnitrophota bacterium]